MQSILAEHDFPLYFPKKVENEAEKSLVDRCSVASEPVQVVGYEWLTEVHRPVIEVNLRDVAESE